MILSRCNRNYHRIKIYECGTLAEGIKDTYYKNNPPFTAPVIPLNNFNKLVADYNAKYADYANGGKAQKGDWLIAKTALLKGLDQIADNVDEVANGNEAIVLEGGFKSVKTSRSNKTIPPVPQIDTLERGTQGVLIASCKPLGRDINYGCIISEGVPLDEHVKLEAGKLIISKNILASIQIDESYSRKKTFTNLTPKLDYYFYFFARNAAGVSGLSAAQSIMCA